MDRDVQANPPETRPFGFLEEQSLSLQMLAATKEALVLWREKYYNPNYNGSPAWFAFPKDLPECCRESVSVSLPSRIKAIIDDRILAIGEEIKMWEVNFRAAVIGTDVFNMWDESFARTLARFSFKPRSARGEHELSKYYVSNKKHVDILVKGFDNIFCNSDGSICFQGSVRNLLRKEELDPKMRFRIACMFCLEDEIRQMWPSVNQIQMPSSCDICSVLMRYWEHNLNNVGVNEFPASNELLLMRLKINQNWAAIEHLWDKVSDGFQILQTIQIVRKCDFYSMKRVLLRLKANQLRNVCQQIGDRIFCNIVTHPTYYEYAIDSWTLMKDYISDDMSVKIVHRLWQLVFNPSESELARVNRNSSLLLKLWTSAADSLKSKILGDDLLFEKLDCVVRGVHHYDVTFMLKLLVNTSCRSKKEIWLKTWRKWMIRVKPAHFELLMKLCLEHDYEVEQFKERTATNVDELNDYFDDCLHRGLYSELHDWLIFFVKNPRRLENMSKEMIFSNLDRIACCDETELNHCRLFIRNTFRDSETAEKFIKDMISTPECLGWVYCKLDDCCFDKVMNLYRRFPSSKTSLKETKEEFLVYSHRNFARGQIFRFHEQKFIEFAFWCAVGEEQISKFKNSLIIDDIFEIILNNFIRNASERPRREPTDQLLISFDNFLRWYFGSADTAKHYKSIKLIDYDEWEGVKNAFQKTVPKRVRKEFLNWGLENDEDKVENVMSRLSQEC